MKTKEELNALKEEVEALSAKLVGLTAEELEQMTGGSAPGRVYWKDPSLKKDNSSSDGKQADID